MIFSATPDHRQGWKACEVACMFGVPVLASVWNSWKYWLKSRIGTSGSCEGKKQGKSQELPWDMPAACPTSCSKGWKRGICPLFPPGPGSFMPVNCLLIIFPPPFGILLNTTAAHSISGMKAILSRESTNSTAGAEWLWDSNSCNKIRSEPFNWSKWRGAPQYSEEAPRLCKVLCSPCSRANERRAIAVCDRRLRRERLKCWMWCSWWGHQLISAAV